MRYSIDSENEYIYDDLYARNYMVINVESQRILIRQPKEAGNLAKLSIFYFTEVLCESINLSELGEFQSYLFMGSNMNTHQMHSDDRQISSLTPWFPFYKTFPQTYEYPPCQSTSWTIQISMATSRIRSSRRGGPDVHCLVSVWLKLDLNPHCLV